MEWNKKILLHPMQKKIVSILFVINLFLNVQGQNDAIVQEGEVGLSLGAGHYFGDINNQAGFNKPRTALGVFFR